MKLCFLAPSEYGKNTAVKILSKKYPIKNIKIAEPLYHLQKYFYDYISTPLQGEQDGELLQYLGKKIRNENPSFLLKQFLKELQCLDNYQGIITNDDCRPPDYQFLKDLGFIFVKINGFKRARIDHSKSDPSSCLEWHNNTPHDYVVNNLGTLQEYEDNLYRLMEKIFQEKEIRYE